MFNNLGTLLETRCPRTDGRTDGQTDGRTDGQTDMTTYRAAIAAKNKPTMTTGMEKAKKWYLYFLELFFFKSLNCIQQNVDFLKIS